MANNGEKNTNDSQARDNALRMEVQSITQMIVYSSLLLLVGVCGKAMLQLHDRLFDWIDRADELHGKHTLFGRCVGDTFFSMFRLGLMMETVPCLTSYSRCFKNRTTR